MIRIILAFLSLQVLIGLIVIQSEQTTVTKSGLDAPLKGKSNSQKYYEFEYRLLNQQINPGIIDSLQLLDDNFERDYLSALISKRKSDYTGAFHLLFKHLTHQPGHFTFYEELVAVAKASNNLSKIEEYTKNTTTNHSVFTDYLSALLAYHSANYSEAIKLLNGKDNFEALYQLSFAYRGLSDYENALISLQKCKVHLNSSDKNLAKVLIAEGSLYLLSGDLERAEQLYKQGQTLAIKTGNQKDEAKALINLAIVDDNYGRVDKAKIKLKSALGLSRKIQNQELEATALSELGVAYTYTNEIVDARENYEKSLSIYKVLNSKERLSNLSANIASLYVQQGNYSQAVKFYEEGLNYAGENVVSKILNLRGLGDVYSNLSNYSKALKYYEEAKALASQIKNINYELSTDVSIGTLYYNVNKPGNALNVFMQAKEKLNGEVDIYLIEDLYFKIGLALSAVNKINEGNDYFAKALNIAEMVGDVYNEILISSEIAYNLILLKEYPKAEKLLASLLIKSKRLSIPQLTAVQNLYLANLNFELGKILKARDYFVESIKESSNIKDYNTLISAQMGLAKCYELNNNYQEAENIYQDAIKNIENLSEVMIDNSEIQIAHFSDKSEVYNCLTELFLKQNRNYDAFEVLERSRSRNTFQNLFQIQAAENSDDSKTLKEYFDLKWKINSGLYDGENLKSLEGRYALLKKSNFNFGNYNQSFSVEKIKNSIGRNTVFITYFITDEKLYAFKLEKDTLKKYELNISRPELEKLIERISPLYIQNNSSENTFINQDLFSFNSKASFEFYNILLRDMLSGLSKNSHLVFSLPAELMLVPMEFLVSKFDENDSPFLYSNKKFLIDDYSISYTPSFSVYTVLSNRTGMNNDKILLVGDPAFENNDIISGYRSGLLEDNSFKSRNFNLFPLKYSRDEIENLSNLFSNKTVLVSNEATESNFKKNSRSSKIIHLSTHSFLFKNQPLIVFSKGDKSDTTDDGYLEASEIYNLKLNSDMVVLSSCKSGLGTIDKAEGILGMQKSFFDAGAKSVIVSMWDVNDKYTALFMKKFYEYLNNGYDKSEALRKAKIFFKENYSANPYYWAAFILAGNTSSIDFPKSGFFSTFIIILFSLSLLILSIIIYFRLKQN